MATPRKLLEIFLARRVAARDAPPSSSPDPPWPLPTPSPVPPVPPRPQPTPTPTPPGPGRLSLGRGRSGGGGSLRPSAPSPPNIEPLRQARSVRAFPCRTTFPAAADACAGAFSPRPESQPHPRSLATLGAVKSACLTRPGSQPRTSLALAGQYLSSRPSARPPSRRMTAISAVQESMEPRVR